MPVMRPETKTAVDQLVQAQYQQYNAVPGAAFTTTPADQQKVIDERLKTNPMMERINRVMVRHPAGQTLFGRTFGTVHSRGTTRTPKEKTSDRLSRYEVAQRHFDTVIPYTLLDKFFALAAGDQNVFAQQISGWYAQQQANETAAIALRGTQRHIDPQSLATDELRLQGMDFGFEQLLRDATYGNLPNIIDNLADGSSVVLIGSKREASLQGAVVASLAGGLVSIPLAAHGFVPGGYVEILGTTHFDGKHLLDLTSDANNLIFSSAYLAETIGSMGLIKQFGHFESLDVLVSESLVDLIPEEVALEGSLEVMLSRQVSSEARTKAWVEFEQKNQQTAEKAYVARLQETYGGLTATQVMGMKPRQLMITAWDNLSYYEQEGTRRKKVEDRPEYNGLVSWDYCEATQAIEDVRKIIIVNNLHVLQKHPNQFR